MKIVTGERHYLQARISLRAYKILARFAIKNGYIRKSQGKEGPAMGDFLDDLAFALDTSGIKLKRGISVARSSRSRKSK